MSFGYIWYNQSVFEKNEILFKMELGEENATYKEKYYLVTETNCKADGIVGAANLIMNTQENLIVDEALLDTTNDLLNLSLIMNRERETDIGHKR